MKTLLIIRVVVMTFVTLWLCGRLFAQSVSSNNVYSPEQLLYKILSLDVSNLQEFAQNQKTNTDFNLQFDRMLDHLNHFDEEQLLGFVKTGFDNGWPIDVVSGMFGKAINNIWDKKPMDANRVCTQITDKAVHPGCKLFIIMGAQRFWSQQWSEADVIRFNEYVADYASNTNINFDLRLTPVEGLLTSARKHLSSNASDETKMRFRNAVHKFVTSALENAKGDRMAEAALVGNALRGYAVMQIGLEKQTSSTDAMLTNIISFLTNTNSSVSTVRMILEAQEAIDLGSMLKPEEMSLLKKDRRFTEPEDQEMLQRLSENIAKRKHPRHTGSGDTRGQAFNSE